MKAPFVLLWIGFCRSPWPGEARAGLTLCSEGRPGTPAEMWSLTKGASGTGNSGKVNLGMGIVNTVN